MIRFPTLLASLLLLLCLAACTRQPSDDIAVTTPRLIPMPASLETKDGSFVIDAKTPVVADGEAAQRVARQFIDLLVATGSVQPKIGGSGSGIRFALDQTDTETSPEAYSLDITADGITIAASSEAGLFYGAVTLWQLLTSGEGNGPVRLPALHIEDAPRFAWRGLMLDSARHFQSVEDIEKLLDAMALHKLNVFHWHLTDDQGWRIEIKRYPKLTEVGSCRIPAGDGGIDPDSGEPVPYCGYYSQDQIRDIVAYAAARHITVVPEIDVPGHATAAIAAYPQLGVSGEAIAVSADRGIHANLFNIEDATFAFLDTVLAEVTDLFPGTYVHIGGDEAIKDQWKASPRVQARMRELGIADEAKLQSWFIGRLETLLEKHGKRLIGWDEILEGGLPPEATVMSWRGTEGGIEAARQGHDVVMSPVASLYFDYLQTGSTDEPAGRPKRVTLQTVYDFDPVPAELDAAQHHHVLGLQANMWTGDTRTFAGVEHAVFPRLAALAEAGWTPATRKDYAGFLGRLPAQLRRYRTLDIGYARTPFRVEVDAEAGAVAGTATITLSNPLGYPLRYTLDGSEPHAAMPEQPLRFDVRLPVELRAAAYANDAALDVPQDLRIDRDTLLSRDNKQLAACPDSGPVLRMEDDGPLRGERALFDVAFLAPCWQWNDAPLQGIDRIEVRAGRLPYFIRLSAEEDAKRRYLPTTRAYGELDVRSGGCDGPRVAHTSMPADPDADGFVTVHATLDREFDSAQTLCLRFSGDTRPAMWLLDRITLLPASAAETR
ncbi:beta-hexosaminidase [Pseudoxanthomonas kalamensis DSM 18571]|uniref:beta-N-acetylhexosaminidase n=1 Tax=Pseudoxanthomonas kalamensis TaxID=289483 RepID=UPI00139168F1|nr:beta-N-acetylhexosaminidase [Pseudoxanthomonas kalamensis]KAF1712124.1 beta-hexosaminidase [Pseudoxanthomonas kalamensis DSM 18571]